MIDIQYGAFSFDPQPVPFMTVSKEYVKTPDNLNLSTNISVTLEGKIVKETGGISSSVIDVMGQMDEIREAFNQDGLLFQGIFNSNVFFSGYPRVLSLNFDQSPDNWVATAPFTIELEFDTTDPTEDSSLLPPFLQNSSESWSIEPIDENYSTTYKLPNEVLEGCPYKFRVTHEVSAVGKSAYNAGGLIKNAWEWARQHVTGLLGYDHSKVSQQGSVTFDISSFGQFNHNRITTVNENEGSVSVTEGWLVLETGVGSGLSGNAIENFNVNAIQGISDGLTKIDIQGEIRGLSDISLTGGAIGINEHAYSAASGYWKNVKNSLLQRVKLIGNTLADRNIHPIATNTTVTHSPCNGIINYSYSFDDRPALCTPNALTEEIEIIDENPTDIFGSLTILGRSVGPILQDMSTITASTRTANINIVLEPATGCPTEFANWFSQKPTGVQDLIDDLEQDLEGNNNKVFKNNDVEDWRATEGQYSRTVTWTFTDC